MNTRSLVIALVLGLALALVAFGITILIGNAQGWWSVGK
jgi:hypothetical protein